MLDNSAKIHPGAEIAEDVELGPWTLIGEHVKIDSGCKIASHVVIKGPTTIGKNNQVFQFSSIGEIPQDKKFKGENTKLEIGDNNIIREAVTINRGTKQGGGITKIGSNNLFMAYVHVAHDSIIHNDIVLANNATLAGHVVVNSSAIIGGFVAIHQFCSIGEYTMIGGNTGVTKDVPPYVRLSGANNPSTYGLNTIGLQRNGFSAETLRELKQAYKLFYRKGLLFNEALEQLSTLASKSSAVRNFYEFIKNSKRGVH